MKEKTIKAMHYLTLIPFIGYFIVFYYGFFNVKKLQYKKETFIYCIISLGSLLVMLILIMIITVMLLKNALINIVIAVFIGIVVYAVFTMAGLISISWFKRVWNKYNHKRDDLEEEPSNSNNTPNETK